MTLLSTKNEEQLSENTSMNQLLGKAIRFALEAHAEQVDKAGMPYAGHIMRVMAAGKTNDEKIVGVLHDVVEDTAYTFDFLFGRGFSPAYCGCIALFDQTI